MNKTMLDADTATAEKSKPGKGKGA